MKKHLSQIWQQFRVSFAVEASLNAQIETGKAVLEVAKTLKKESLDVEALKTLLQNSSSLLDVLCLPLTQVLQPKLSFMEISIALLKFYHEKTQQYPSLEDCVFIVSQAAYLESVKEILSLYPSVNWEVNHKINNLVKEKLEKLNNIELDDQSAEQAVACFHESKLASAFNQVLLANLIITNIPKSNALYLTKRIAWHTHRYMIEGWLKLDDFIKNVNECCLMNLQKEQHKFQVIDKYLQNSIKTKYWSNIFAESFSLPDIYVPLKAQILQNTDTIDLEKWAKEILLTSRRLEVIFIQGYPGRGKSFFCQMFADWVRKHLYPLWTPILIRVKDIEFFENNLESTLQAELKAKCLASDENLLTHKNLRFLFILDGFDELHIKIKNQLNIEAFIKQVAKFQQECNNNSEMGHRVLITGNSVSLKNIHGLPSNLQRVEIIGMDMQLQQMWLDKWQRLQLNSNKKLTLQQFLYSNSCPDKIKNLAQEPLFLYLLAAMYRDDKITVEQLQQVNCINAKIVVYQAAVEWMIAKQYDQSDRSNFNNIDNHLNIAVTKQQSQDFKRILTEAAVCVVQSGGEFASMSMLEARLEEDETAKAIILAAKEKLKKASSKIAWAAFYIYPVNKQEKKFEFYHKSFSEFLFAEHLKTHLQALLKHYAVEDESQFMTTDTQMNWQIYDLLGFGNLTPEIVEYLMNLLAESQDFSWEQLFQRLENFYRDWCQGKFIDSAEESLPQKKLQQLQKYGIQELGQRQVDIYADLNVMILLLELHRYAQQRDHLKHKIIFYPSSQAKKEFSWKNQLLRIINYSDCILSRDCLGLEALILCLRRSYLTPNTFALTSAIITL